MPFGARVRYLAISLMARRALGDGGAPGCGLARRPTTRRNFSPPVSDSDIGLSIPRRRCRRTRRPDAGQPAKDAAEERARPAYTSEPDALVSVGPDPPPVQATTQRSAPSETVATKP